MNVTCCYVYQLFIYMAGCVILWFNESNTIHTYTSSYPASKGPACTRHNVRPYRVEEIQRKVYLFHSIIETIKQYSTASPHDVLPLNQLEDIYSECSSCVHTSESPVVEQRGAPLRLLGDCSSSPTLWDGTWISERRPDENSLPLRPYSQTTCTWTQMHAHTHH